MDDVQQLYDRWVRPVYMLFLHGNFTGLLLASQLTEDRTRAITDVRRCLAEVDATVIEALLGRPEWRARLAASWYAGLHGWRRFNDFLGSKLLASEHCFAGQGYCAALACYSDPTSAEYLRRYLDVWLPRTDKFYDQHWALPALVWVDRQLDTHHAEPYLRNGGLWDQWATAAARRRNGHDYYAASQLRFDMTLTSALAGFRTA
jgi:hypothetical protein